MELRRIIDLEGTKVFLFYEVLPEPATAAQKGAFLHQVMNYMSQEYPGTPANYYEESNIDTLSIVVIVGINNVM